MLTPDVVNYAGPISIRKYLVLYCSLLCASLDEMKGIWKFKKKSSPGYVEKESDLTGAKFYY